MNEFIKTSREMPAGSLVQITNGVVGELTGRIGRIADQWMLEVESEGATAWWHPDFIKPAYE